MRYQKLSDNEKATLRALWCEACKVDGIDPAARFAVFSDGNAAARRYNDLVSLLLTREIDR